MNISNRHNIKSLKERSEINKVFHKGEKISTRFGPIFFYQSTDNGDSKKVAILLKKNVGTSVKRNYIKRIIRYFVTQHKAILEHSNRIIFLYNSKNPINYPLLKKEYLRVLQK
jgi:ribonuclease P protein component